MTLYGVGLGPGEADLVTVRGKRLLDAADVVHSPGRLSRTVVAEHVPASKIGDLDFAMTRDSEKLRAAWRDAALDGEQVAFVEESVEFHGDGEVRGAYRLRVERI